MRYLLITLFLFVSSLVPLSAFDFSSLVGEDKKEKSESPASVADLQKQLTSSIDKAKDSFGDNPELVSRLKNIAKESGAGEDLSMVQNLSGLMDMAGGGVMTEGQKELLAEVRGHAQALALTRNFSDDPGLQGPVQKAVKAVQGRDTMAAVSSLKEISDKGSLNNLQKQLLKSMLGDYGSYLDKAGQAAGAVDQLKSLF